MSWAHEWHPVAEDDLRRMHWREAARVDAAVQRLAESGQGRVEPVRGERNLYRLRVSRSVVLFARDSASRTIRVWRVFKA
jgi:mRNA-degrading endonuclease RelE of RelBE toxin-antitoxin system